MRALCCLDGFNIEQIRGAIANLLQNTNITVGLLYVIDSGPHGDLERQRERFLRGPAMPPRRREQMQQAEAGSAQDILDEGVRAFPQGERLRRAGRPEREIVNCAAEWRADLILICPRTIYDDKPALGPKSVGHVARFVLDHAPCPVLLVRPLTLEQFPLER